MNATVQFLRRAPEIRFARICGWTVDVAANRVQRGDVDLRLTPKAMAVLRELMQRQGTVVRRDDLLGIVWRDGFPTDDVLTHAVTELRRALEDDPRAPKIIETIPKVGYRLVAPVEVIEIPSVAAATAAPALGETTEESERAQPPRALSGALALLALVAVALPSWHRAVSNTGASAISATPSGRAPALLQPVALTSDLSREQFPSLSPDGSTVVYAALAEDGGMSRIMVKSLDPSALPVALTDPKLPERDDYPVWSPDGKQIAFLRAGMDDCSINLVAASGGKPRKVAGCTTRTVDYIDWTADSRGLLVSRREMAHPGAVGPAVVHRIDLDSGERHRIVYAPLPVGAEDLQPKSSPDGKWIAFRRGAAPYSDLYVIPAEGGTAREVAQLRARVRGFAWDTDSAHLVFSSDHAGRQALFRIAITGGEAVALGVTEAHFPAVARNAPVLVYQLESGLLQLAQIRLGPEGQIGERQLVAPSTRSDWFPILSPSAARLAFVSLRSGSQQLWIHEFESGATYPVTHLEDVDVGFPQWSPDESSVLFVTRGRGESSLRRVQIASARVERLTQPNERVRYGSYSRDGKSIFLSTDRSGSWQVWRMAPDGSGAQMLSSSGGFDPRDFLGDGTIFYVKETDLGLFRLDLKTREERRVSWMAGYWNMDSITVRGAFLYYVEIGEDGHTWLMKAPLHPNGLSAASDAKPGSDNEPSRMRDGLDPETVRYMDLRLSKPGREASISDDLSMIVAVQVPRDETDLMTAVLPK